MNLEDIVVSRTGVILRSLSRGNIAFGQLRLVRKLRSRVEFAR